MSLSSITLLASSILTHRHHPPYWEKQVHKDHSYSGGCSCGEVRYRLRNPPLFVHACHCLDCQKASGSAFGITTIVLENDISSDHGVIVSKPSDAKRTTFICGSCGDVIYRTASNHPATALLSSRTLDDMRVLEINAHIWTKEKHAWLELPAHVPQFVKGYDRDETWPRESLERLCNALGKVI